MSVSSDSFNVQNVEGGGRQNCLLGRTNTDTGTLFKTPVVSREKTVAHALDIAIASGNKEW